MQKPDFGKEAVPHDDATDDDTALNPSPVDSSSSQFGTGPGLRAQSPGARHESLDRSTARPVKPVNAIGSTQGQKDRSPSWDELRGSLQVLKDNSKSFPPLGSAIESLLLCLNGFEIAVRNHQDYEDLAIELTTLSESLKHHMSESSILVSSSTNSAVI